MRSFIVLAFIAGCATARFDERPLTPKVSLEHHQTRNVIVVTVDGVRWQEVFGGVDPDRARKAGFRAWEITGARELLPNLHRYFVDDGVVIGAHGEMVASGPNYVSLPGYREIFTGHPSSTCTSNFCGAISENTLLDELRAGGLRTDEIAVVTSWPTIERAAARDPRGITISAGRHGGVTRDHARMSFLFDEAASASAYPGWFDYRPDRYTGEIALQYLAAQRPRFLFVGLGDTDEYAHRGNYRGYVASLRAADRFVGELVALLATMGEYGASTTILVTTDHGRAAGFVSHGNADSARVWMMATGGSIPSRGTVDIRQTVRLSNLAPTIRALMSVPSRGQAIAALVSPTLMAFSTPPVQNGNTTRHLP